MDRVTGLIRVDSGYKFSESFLLNANMTLSSNKNKEIISLVDGSLFNHGKTNIIIFPSIISQVQLYLTQLKKQVFLSKYVGSQYMGNTDAINSA